MSNPNRTSKYVWLIPTLVIGTGLAAFVFYKYTKNQETSKIHESDDSSSNKTENVCNFWHITKLIKIIKIFLNYLNRNQIMKI